MSFCLICREDRPDHSNLLVPVSGERLSTHNICQSCTTGLLHLDITIDNGVITSNGTQRNIRSLASATLSGLLKYVNSDIMPAIIAELAWRRDNIPRITANPWPNYSTPTADMFGGSKVVISVNAVLTCLIEEDIRQITGLQHWTQVKIDGEGGMAPAEIEKVFDVLTLPGRNPSDSIFVHCHSGTRMSPGVVYGLYRRILGPGSKVLAEELMRTNSPGCDQPSKEIMSAFDGYLNYED